MNAYLLVLQLYGHCVACHYQTFVLTIQQSSRARCDGTDPITVFLWRILDSRLEFLGLQHSNLSIPQSWQSSCNMELHHVELVQYTAAGARLLHSSYRMKLGHCSVLL